MKKSFLVLLFVGVSLLVKGQDSAAKPKPNLLQKFLAPHEVTAEERLAVDSTTNKVSYKEIVEAKGLTKKALFEKAKKWVATKDSKINPYTISFENEQDGSLIAKGSFQLPSERKKYVVQYTIKINTKEGKFKYECTNMMLQLKTNAGSSSGGYGGFGGTSYKEADVLEYSIETFYPSRLTSKKPAIKYFEEINAKSFAAINKEMQGIVSTLRETMSSKEDW